MRQEERKRLALLASRAEVRRRNVADFWLRFSKYLRPWLLELTRRHKERWSIPPFACWILPSYYTDCDDRDVAAIVAMLVPNNAKVTDNCRELRSTIGEHPMEWFRTRSFVRMGFADERDRIAGGVKYWKIAELMSVIWELKRREGLWMLEEAGLDDSKVRMARMVMSQTDQPDDRKALFLCPITDEVRQTLHTFWPDWRRYGSVDDAIRLFGFERDSDFFFAALAWKELQRKTPRKCSHLVTVLKERYDDGMLLGARYWTGNIRGILPKLE